MNNIVVPNTVVMVTNAGTKRKLDDTVTVADKEAADMERLVIKAERAAERMISGFSVALYGCGSKRSVLDALSGTLKAHFSAGDFLVRVRGFDQTFPMVRSFSAAMPGRGRRNAIRNQSDVIRAVSKLPKSHRLFVLIDSIDAVPMRGNQEFFAKLAAHANVFLCASMDHCKAPLLWSASQQRRFKWTWLDASTYEGYSAEVKDLVSFWDDLIEGKAEAATRSLALVVSSLTGAHREIVGLVAKMQLELIEAVSVVRNSDEKVTQEMVQVRSTELLKRCKKHMIVDNQIKMRALLGELIDHRVVLNMKDKETGNEVFWLPFDTERLQAVASNEFK